MPPPGPPLRLVPGPAAPTAAPPSPPRRLGHRLLTMLLGAVAVGAALAAPAVFLLAHPPIGPAAAQAVTVAPVGEFDCADMQHITHMGADAGSTRFHNGAIKGYAEGDWVPFRMTFDWKGGTFDGPCIFISQYDHMEATPTPATGFDALRFTGLAFGDAAFTGCTGTVGTVHASSADPPSVLWVAWTITGDDDGGRCTLRVDAHLATDEGGTPGAAAFPGCSLHARLTAPPGMRARCVHVADQEAVPCPGPADVTAISEMTADGPVNTVTWTAVAGVTGYNVLRAEAGGSFEFLADVAVTEQTYVDAAVVAGTTYAYQVTADAGPGDLRACDEAEVSAIPDFPMPLAAGLALLGGVAIVARRRRG